MEGALKLGWELANPVVSDFIMGEQKMLEGMSNTMIYFKDNFKRFTEINKRISNPDTKMKQFNYDPVKYIKGKDIIRRVSVSRSLPFPIPINSNEVKNLKSRPSFTPDLLKFDKNKVKIDNILTQFRLTNSFGEIKEDKLKEFLEFEDDFD